MTPDADHSAMKSLQAGREQALGEIMHRWKAPIAAYIYRMLNNYHDAVELAQEVFVKVYFERSRFNVEKPFGPWIYTIASNLAKNRLRWRFRHKSETLNETTVAEMEPQLTAEEGVMMECLRKLSTELREVIVLFDIEERSHEEIAVIIGKGRKTVEARLYKARQMLKQAYISVNKAPRKVASSRA